MWSARSLVAPFVYATLTAGALWCGRFILQLLALSPSADTIERRVAATWARLAAELSLHDALVFEPGLVTLGILALATIAWQFNGLIQAWGSNISIAPAERIVRLGPGNEPEKILYRAVLTVLLLLFTGGLIHAIRLWTDGRRSDGDRLPHAWPSLSPSCCSTRSVSHSLHNQAPRDLLQRGCGAM